MAPATVTPNLTAHQVANVGSGTSNQTRTGGAPASLNESRRRLVLGWPRQFFPNNDRASDITRYHVSVFLISNVIRCIAKGVTILRESSDCGILDVGAAISTDIFHSFHCFYLQGLLPGVPAQVLDCSKPVSHLCDLCLQRHGLRAGLGYRSPCPTRKPHTSLTMPSNYKIVHRHCQIILWCKCPLCFYVAY